MWGSVPDPEKRRGRLQTARRGARLPFRLDNSLDPYPNLSTCPAYAGRLLSGSAKCLENPLPGAKKPDFQRVLLDMINLPEFLQREALYFLERQQHPVLFGNAVEQRRYGFPNFSPLAFFP